MLIVVQVAAVIAGTVLSAAVLLSALETVILPRGGFTRLTRAVFAATFRVMVRPGRSSQRARNRRALYPAVALVALPLVWSLLVTVGFTAIFWGLHAGDVFHSFEFSGSSLFTLGFAVPPGTARIWLTFVEATIGLGLVALLISYLPTVYAAHRDRERGQFVLRPLAGAPASAVTLVESLHRFGAGEDDDLWQTASAWIIEVGQTHIAFPALCQFPESLPDQSWVATVGCVLDAAALLLSVVPPEVAGHDLSAHQGPLLVLAYGIPTLAGVGQASGLPVDTPPRLLDLLGAAGPTPEVTVARHEYLAALDRLTGVLAVPEGDHQACWERFSLLRSGYDRSLRALAGLTLAVPAPWTTDRPATVGPPRLVGHRPLAVDWPPEGAT